MTLSGFRAFGSRAIPQAITSSQYRHLHRFLSSAASTTTSAGSDVAMAVKKVTLSNFCSVLEDLRIRIREADFVAIDLEMTGVTSAPWRDSFEFDRSDVRYLKVKDSAEKFAVVQFGLCTLRWDACQGSFIAHPEEINIQTQILKDTTISKETVAFYLNSRSTRGKHSFSQQSRSNSSRNSHNFPVSPDTTNQGSLKPTCQICNKVGHTAVTCWHRCDLNYTPSPRAMLTTSPYEWVLDTGATSHLTTDAFNLQQSLPYQGSNSISIANDNTLPIQNSGDDILPLPQSNRPSGQSNSATW